MTDPAEPSAAQVLDAARRAFERGDYREVRRKLRPLLAGELEVEQRAEAEELLSRLRPDPFMAYLLLLCTLLLLAATLFAYRG